MTSDKCGRRVYRNRGLISSPCSRKAWKDGYCRIHHPENEKARREKSEKRYLHQEAVRKEWICKDAIKEATRQARRDALNEAAMICEDMYLEKLENEITGQGCANAIRKRLKEYDNVP